MRAVEDVHWWYRCLHRRTLNTLQRCFSDTSKINVLDAGCGTGGLIRYLKSHGVASAFGIDVSQAAVNICTRDGLNVIQMDIEDIDGSKYIEQYDAIVCHDMLYFIDAPSWAEVTENLGIMLKPGGIMLLNLPHGAAFSGIHDQAVGIPRRFEYRDIKDIFPKRMFSMENVTFWPIILSPIIFTVRLGQRIKRRYMPDNQPASDIDLPNRFLNTLMRRLACFDSAVLNRLRFASSMLLVLRKHALD